MCLKRAVVINNGPIKMLELDLQLSTSLSPKPIILVGVNGGGKSNLLSLVADALHEAAAKHFIDILPEEGARRQMFRVLGGGTIRHGCEGSLCLLEFEDENTPRIYLEKCGDLKLSKEPYYSEKKQIFEHVNLKKGNFKEMRISGDRARDIFENQVFAFFPSNRSETPHWLNKNAIVKEDFDIDYKMHKVLGKPIYVDHALDQFKQWLVGVLIDSRLNFTPFTEVYNQALSDDAHLNIATNSTHILNMCNKLLQEISHENDASFGWLGRKSYTKIGMLLRHDLLLDNLNALSTGQATLLGIFGTLIRYSDMSRRGPAVDFSSIEGICVVDEIDSHLHVELQNRALPRLIKLFPKMQFILSRHSPIFVLGMEKAFGSDGIQVVDMPSGRSVNAESYIEFGSAMDALAESKTFVKRMIDFVHNNSRPIVFVEGETDAIYLKRAVEILDRQVISEKCEIAWIGGKDENDKVFHTGRDALEKSLKFLIANRSLSNRRILFLHDTDSRPRREDYGDISVRSIPANPENQRVTAGIENLLPENRVTDEFYDCRKKRNGDGGEIVTKQLKKMELCKWMCQNGNREDFTSFSKALDLIDVFLESGSKLAGLVANSSAS